MAKKEQISIAIAITAAVSLGALQLAPGPPRSNPPVNHNYSLQTSLAPPAHVASILRKGCMDCHSNETRWPWYSRVAPVSWSVTQDVMRARKAMNLSEWTTGPGRSPGVAIGYLQAMCAGVREERMPPAKYRLLHKESRLTSVERQTLCEWTTTETVRYIRMKRQSPVSQVSQ